MAAPEDIALPGGLGAQAHWFLHLLIRIAGGSGSAVPIDLIAGIIGNARANRAGNNHYGLALMASLMSDEGDGLRLREFFETLVSTIALPSVPKDVSEETMRGMETTLRLVRLEDSWTELRDLANAIADARVNGILLDQYRSRRLQHDCNADEHQASFLRWLGQLAEGSETTPPPDDLPDHITNQLDFWRLKCLTRCNLEDVLELGAAAVRRRLRGEKFSRIHRRTLAALTGAGGIYANLATFVEKMSKPHAMPPVPMGLPPGILSAFASARREALGQEGAGVFVPRKPR
jgi:hypothetical protein